MLGGGDEGPREARARGTGDRPKAARYLTPKLSCKRSTRQRPTDMLVWAPSSHLTAMASVELAPVSCSKTEGRGCAALITNAPLVLKFDVTGVDGARAETHRLSTRPIANAVHCERIGCRCANPQNETAGDIGRCTDDS